jgi:hypothetical protein
VFACAVQEQAFFLDLKRNRYLSTALGELQGISRYVHRWPAHLDATTTSGGRERSESELQATIAELSSCHVLLSGPERASDSAVAPGTHYQPARATLVQHLSGYPRISPAALLWFLKAAAIAKYRLSTRSLYSTVHHIVRRRARHATALQSDDLSALSRLVTVFRRLRPLLPPTGAPCLLRSIALLEFLAVYGHFPRLVFGVQAQPFSAHCWVQHADMLLNATLEDAVAFTPIMIA